MKKKNEKNEKTNKQKTNKNNNNNKLWALTLICGEKHLPLSLQFVVVLGDA